MATHKFDIGEKSLAEHFVARKILTGPIVGLHFKRHNSFVIDTTHGLIQFPHLTMQAENAASDASATPQPLLFHESIIVSPLTTKTITAFVDYASEWYTTGTVTPLEKFTETAGLLIFQSMSTKIDRKVAAKVTNTTETPYPIKGNTQIADLPVVTTEQAKFIKPVDTAFLSMIPEGDPDLNTYLK